MTWQSRLLSLVAAGGFASASACSDSSNSDNFFQCNANPDPCCTDPESVDCKQSKLDAGSDDGIDADASTEVGADSSVDTNATEIGETDADAPAADGAEPDAKSD